MIVRYNDFLNEQRTAKANLRVREGGKVRRVPGLLGADYEVDITAVSGLVRARYNPYTLSLSNLNGRNDPPSVGYDVVGDWLIASESTAEHDDYGRETPGTQQILAQALGRASFERGATFDPNQMELSYNLVGDEELRALGNFLVGHEI